ncbi:MAG: DoxX family membrane protein [Actinomycetales bacterium]|nr:DoxX family membrane protein [Actinomycetales bacterium]
MKNSLRKLLSNPKIGLISRLVLSGILLIAGGAKFFEGGYAAQRAINAYKVFPPSWAPFLGYALPGLEILLGILLLVGIFVRISAVITAVLMAGFIAGIASVWARGYSIDCGCFGGGGEVSPTGKNLRYTKEILRDFLFMGLAVQLAIWPRTTLAIENFGTVRADLAEDLDSDEEPGADFDQEESVKDGN